jgi:hypothetical protein
MDEKEVRRKGRLEIIGDKIAYQRFLDIFLPEPVQNRQ